MPQVTVPTTGITLVASDPDQWRTVIVQNTDATNFIEIEVGSVPTAGQGFIIAKASAASVPNVQSQIPLAPGVLLGARANTASCDVRYLVS